MTTAMLTRPDRILDNPEPERNLGPEPAPEPVPESEPVLEAAEVSAQDPVEAPAAEIDVAALIAEDPNQIVAPPEKPKRGWWRR